MSLTALEWAGGKGANSWPQGPWIASLLPADLNVCWIELYGGMGGQTLQRQPSKQEILNDYDLMVINWWEQVRNNVEELIRLLELTPHSRVEYYTARSLLLSGEHMSPVEKARLFTVAIDSGITKTVARAGFSVRYSTQAGHRRKVGYWEQKLSALAVRLKTVTLECRNAVEILDRVKNEPQCVIYCDPPYPTACDIYGNAELDVEATTELLLQQKGRVAVSGYDDEWSHLDWQMHECDGLGGGVLGPPDTIINRRHERLWTNYDAILQEKLF